jgi:hypothetical protein
MATNITFHPGLLSSPILVRPSVNLHPPGSVTSAERTNLLEQKGVTIWLTGLSASGKVSSTTLEIDLEKQTMLFSQQSPVHWNNISSIFASLRIA